MISSVDLAWTAGFLEGEGSFGYSGRRGSICISANQVQKEPLDRLRALFGGCISTFQRRRPNHSAISQWKVSGHTAAGLMMSLYGLMSPKRRAQMVEPLARWRATAIPWGLRTRCAAGHEYQPHPKGGGKRRCLICLRAWNRRYRGVEIVGPPLSKVEVGRLSAARRRRRREALASA